MTGIECHQMPPTNRPGASRCAGSNWSFIARIRSSPGRRAPDVEPGLERGRGRDHDDGGVERRDAPPACARPRAGIGLRGQFEHPEPRPVRPPRPRRTVGAARAARPRAPAGGKAIRRPSSSPLHGWAAKSYPLDELRIARQRHRGGGVRPATSRRVPRRARSTAPLADGRPGCSSSALGSSCEVRYDATHRARPRPPTTTGSANRDGRGRPAVQPEGHIGQRGQRAVRAGQQLGQVVAGHVLDHLAAGVRDGAVGEHERGPDEQVARGAEAVPHAVRSRSPRPRRRGSRRPRAGRARAADPIRPPRACNAASGRPACARTTRSCGLYSISSVGPARADEQVEPGRGRADLELAPAAGDADGLPGGARRGQRERQLVDRRGVVRPGRAPRDRGGRCS